MKNPHCSFRLSDPHEGAVSRKSYFRIPVAVYKRNIQMAAFHLQTVLGPRVSSQLQTPLSVHWDLLLRPFCSMPMKRRQAVTRNGAAWLWHLFLERSAWLPWLHLLEQLPNFTLPPAHTHIFWLSFSLLGWCWLTSLCCCYYYVFLFFLFWLWFKM